MAGEKSEKATPKKRRDERKKGNIFKSQDIIIILSLVGCFYGLKYLFPYIYDVSRFYMIRCLEYIGNIDSVSNEQVISLQNEVVLNSVKGALPLLLISVAIAILAVGIQTKFLFTSQNLAPKFNRLNPIEGIKKLFAGRNFIELIKNLIKITILIVIIIQFMEGRVLELMRTMEMDLLNSTVYLLKESVILVEKIVMWFIAIAAFDFFYQRWDYERQIKMTKQEVKEEYKQMEGNPEVKGKIREIQRNRARQRMMQAVPEADVVIRNPTHFAVALKYNKLENSAPIVIAKGQDELALRIVKIAEENNVVVIENRPLARAIYASTEIDMEIPSEYYGMVAEILVYVYKLNNKELD